MKKLIALFLAMIMCFGLVACGSDKSTTKTEETDSNTEIEEETSSEQTSSEQIEYAFGDKFGTDNVECAVLDLKWVTPEEFDSVFERTPSMNNGEYVYAIKTEILFPECESSFGSTGGVKSKIADQYFLLVAFSLQNVGKEKIASETEWKDSFGGTVIPYGTFEVIYDDGYTFNCGETSGFTTTLEVLGSVVKVVGGCKVPAQVYENEDKPLKIKVMLPNSSGDTEEFIVSVR